MVSRLTLAVKRKKKAVLAVFPPTLVYDILSYLKRKCFRKTVKLTVWGHYLALSCSICRVVFCFSTVWGHDFWVLFLLNHPVPWPYFQVIQLFLLLPLHRQSLEKVCCFTQQMHILLNLKEYVQRRRMELSWSSSVSFAEVSWDMICC